MLVQTERTNEAKLPGMSNLIHDPVTTSAPRPPEVLALQFNKDPVFNAQLPEQVELLVGFLIADRRARGAENLPRHPATAVLTPVTS